VDSQSHCEANVIKAEYFVRLFLENG